MDYIKCRSLAMKYISICDAKYPISSFYMYFFFAFLSVCHIMNYLMHDFK